MSVQHDATISIHGKSPSMACRTSVERTKKLRACTSQLLGGMFGRPTENFLLEKNWCIITARVRSTREGNVLTRVCVSVQGGTLARSQSQTGGTQILPDREYPILQNGEALNLPGKRVPPFFPMGVPPPIFFSCGLKESNRIVSTFISIINRLND